MDRYLTILEVSQKQKYIFSSNVLSENIYNSDTIARITSGKYIESVVNNVRLFRMEDNLVYAGGGHTIMVFPDEKQAKQVTAMVTEQVIRDYPDIELFAATIPYPDTEANNSDTQTGNTEYPDTEAIISDVQIGNIGKTEMEVEKSDVKSADTGNHDRMKPADYIKELKKKLEHKKALRKASFHQGSFGIERMDPNTGKPVRVCSSNEKDSDTNEKRKNEKRKFDVPEDYALATAFRNLGGSKGESAFIAVIHIDGNGMGKKIQDFADSFSDWETYRTEMQEYSGQIAVDFMSAFKAMNREVAAFLKTEMAEENLSLDLKFERKAKKTDKIADKKTDIKRYFPVRRIITEGDDVCFVTEGRIGIECARIFLENLPDTCHACAGVALVHQKYPFYRAYELAEALCSNAKKFGASLSPEDNGSSVSAIDWHIEFGEIQDTLEDTRKMYLTDEDKKNLEMRPYIVKASEEVNQKEPVRQYGNLRKLMKRILKSPEKDFYASGALKELRSALKRGENAALYYLRYHNMEKLLVHGFQGIYQEMDYEKLEIGSGKSLERKLFIETLDGKKRSALFDAIEVMDTFLLVEED
ncbi:MAG: hypothetical protein MR487_02435 [Lachnospiraceae bacterium]|nr:hypothetical protein [Lachnospiraceae bacterium]